jgi:hypothetical protein
MSYTVATLLSNVQRTFPDLQSARGYDLCNQVHREILCYIPELRRDQFTITPMPGQGEYSIAETEFQIDSVVYVPASGNNIQLTSTTVEGLNKSTPTWRADPSASWEQQGENGPYFYLTNKVLASANLPTPTIGFYPVPNFSTGTITVYASRLQPSDLVSTDTCLDGLLSSQVYVEGVRYYAATELRPDLAGAFKAAYAEQIALNRWYVRTRNEPMKDPGRAKNARVGGYSADGAPSA